MGREHWIDIPLGEIIVARKGKKPSVIFNEPKEDYLPYILIDELEGKQIRSYTNEVNLPCVKETDVLLVWDGSIGKCGSGLNGIIGSTLVGLTPIGSVPTKYLEYLILQANQFIKETSTGIGLQHINKHFYKECIVPLPPLNEQKRIVEKLDAILPMVKSVQARLEKIPGILKKFRQSILAAACSGKLTEDWREDNSDMQDAIEIVIAINNIRKLRNDKISISRLNTEKPDLDTPSKWVLTQIADLYSILTDYHANGSYKILKENVQLLDTPDYAYMIRATNFEKNNFSDIMLYISKHSYEFLRKSQLFGGEILIGKIGNAGKVYFMPKMDKPSSLAMNLFALRFDENLINSKYIYFYLKSRYGEDEISQYIKGIANQTIDKISIRSIYINLPPLPEQHEIVRRVAKLFALADSLEAKYKKAMERVEKIEQSVLAKAFRGELVEPDPNDEPAEELLKKILAEKEKLAVTGKKRKTMF